MGNYIDGFISDEEFIGRDTRLSHKRSREEYLAAKAEGRIDAAIQDKFVKYRVPDDFRKIPGASRSGALDPQTRARLEHDERSGLIEVARNEHGEPIGFRPTAN